MDNTVAAIAENIIGYIRKEDIDGLARSLTMSDGEWRQELRYEFDLEKMMEAIFRNDIWIPKLIMCDIQTISPFHYAALRGVDLILERFVLQYQIPVDMCVKSGSTALHFACFSGALDTVTLLVERFHADINRKDRYGWTALHYASTEGNLPVIEYLVRQGADISARDKDGTTAAFRAQAFGHVNIVSYFVQSGGDEDLLLVEESMVEPEEDSDIYTTIDTSKKSNGSKIDPSHYEMAVTTSVDEGLFDRGKGKDDVANLVRDQLNEILGGAPDPYMNPVSRGGVGGEGGGRVSLDIGVNTLTRILKDEFMKFKTGHEIKGAADSNLDSSSLSEDKQVFYSTSDYEDISKFAKDTIRSQNFNLDQIASPKDEFTTPEVNPPPLPAPRSSSIVELKEELTPSKHNPKRKSGGGGKKKRKSLDRVNYATLTFDEVAKRHPAKTKALLILNRFDHSNTVMDACFQALVQNIGDVENWKQISAALPLRNRPDAVKRRIRNIELQHPADPRKQALSALQDWRYYFGEAANVEALTAAMKQCGLEDKVTLVETAALEFNA